MPHMTATEVGVHGTTRFVPVDFYADNGKAWEAIQQVLERNRDGIVEHVTEELRGYFQIQVKPSQIADAIIELIDKEQGDE
jgi:predicted metal-dependent hydrolase